MTSYSPITKQLSTHLRCPTLDLHHFNGQKITVKLEGCPKGLTKKKHYDSDTLAFKVKAVKERRYVI